MNRNNIVISTYDSLHNPYYGGGGAIAIHEVSKILSREYDITVLTGKYPGSFDTVVEGVRYAHVGVFRFGPLFGQLFFHFAIIRTIRKMNFDCLIESFTPPFSTSCTPLLTKKPVIGLVHMLAGKDMSRKYKIPFHYLERFGLRFYRRIIVVTDEMKDKIRAINPNISITIIPNAVNVSSIVLSNEPKKYIVYLGRIDIEVKGLDLLINAYKRDRKKDLPPLIIIGNGLRSEVKRLQQIIRKEELQDRIILYGKAGEFEKGLLFSYAYGCVLPSRSEAFSLTALECLKIGIPLITFDIDGLRWIPNDVSIKTERFNSDELKNNIIRLIADEKLQNQLIDRGRAFSEQFNWQNSANRYAEVITDTLKNNSGNRL